ncbi:hypothetical protein P8452_03975 [Trifolium repens]|nr:hypothetical protein P8452_03975 [Trifolium repens]
MKNIVSSAFTVHQMANGNRKNNTQWLYPKTKKQPNSIDCGYYSYQAMSCMNCEKFGQHIFWSYIRVKDLSGVRVSSRCKFNNGLEFHLAI